MSVVKNNNVCELCRAEATLYCDSDAAFLCSDCDRKVHSANFLVARHLRQPICRLCRSVTGRSLCGPRPHLPLRLTCRSCSPEEAEDEESEADVISCSSSSSTSSACISSSESQPRPRRTSFSRQKPDTPATYRTQAIFINWCKKLGVEEGAYPVITRAASRAAGWLWLGRTRISNTNVPFRVSLAASFWFGVKVGYGGGATWHNLKRLEEASGVPGNIIVAVETKVEDALKKKVSGKRRSRASSSMDRSNQRRRGSLDLEEGWAECSI